MRGDQLARLADILAEASSGPRPSPRELAELLWLARHMEPHEPDAPRPPGPARQARPAEDRPSPPPQPTPPASPPTPQQQPQPPAPAPPQEPARVPLHLPGSGKGGGTGRPHTTLLAPSPPMLRHPLGLQRALRPLKRRIAAPTGLELDEHATADRIARLGAGPEWWLPIMRPSRERWLCLNLVHDTGPTMPVWRPLIRELHTALAQSGVFRTVTPYRARPDGTVCGDDAPAPVDGRTVTLVISDCMGPQWRRGAAGTLWYRTLRRWARRMPLAVVQPLPEHLWRDTALPTTPGRLTAPHPAAPTTTLRFTPYEPQEIAAVPLPVMEPDPRWLANWAALVAAPGGAELPAAVGLLDRPPDALEDRTDAGLLSSEELVLRFRATASPEAFRLAGHLAVGRPDLPVMRLVHAALEPEPRPQHLAEVILSGMLTTVPGPAGSYAFRDGVRDLLLRSLPRTARSRTTELLERVGGLIDHRAGRAPGEFRASTPAPAGTEPGADGEAFATVGPEVVRRLAGTPVDGLAEQTVPSGPPSPVILFEADDLTGHPEARITLEYAVDRILDRAALAHREVQVRDDGYLVLAPPGSYALPVLVATLRGLADRLAQLPDPPRLRVTFWHTPASGTGVPDLPAEVRTLQDRTTADVLVVISPSWYEEFAASSAALDRPRFRPVLGDAADAPPVAWYHPLHTSGPEPEERDLVTGPFITHDLRRLGIPAPGRTAIVHTQPDGPLTLLNPAQPLGTRPPRRTTYYEVDLTAHQAVHQVSLPSSGRGAFAATVELSWHVVDPVSFVRGETAHVSGRLLDHLLDAAARITRRHPLRRAGAAQRAVNAGLRRWPVPGLAVAYTVQLAAESARLPEPHSPAPRSPSDLLADAETVLLGFDGPVTRLFSAHTAREAVLALLSVVAEHRDPDEALAGRPLPRAAEQDLFPHPLDVLRAFAHDRLGPMLRDRLDQLELQAVPNAPLTHNANVLIRTLHHSGRRVAVVTDVCEQAAHHYLDHYRLPLEGLHGRARDLARLTPDPDCLLRALGSPDAPAATGVLIGSTVAELTAAQQIGLGFIGLARNPTVDQSLREAGCETTVSSLAPLLDVARAL
ncbi:SAV_2336 N-terminal domain-related protein [Streptomyces spinosisporus]|uniref:Serine/threonine protein kinase n=1 Tax=Streptomyces spinosisporus TaxID=2927582 RepID=A0ABS9XCW5_9ACTN|nr:SAV_2336 N-terminal domain-related protein [Streptomyces spinosisporus]MCI3239883.1 serine/threonine protein kinase [Streptomyces spinosisporus]